MPFFLSQASWKTPKLVPSTFSSSQSSTHAYLASAPFSGLKLRNSSQTITISSFLGFLSYFLSTSSYSFFLFVFSYSYLWVLLPLFKSDGPQSSHVRLSSHTVYRMPSLDDQTHSNGFKFQLFSFSWFQNISRQIDHRSTGHLYLGVTKTQIPCPRSSSWVSPLSTWHYYLLSLSSWNSGHHS